MSGRDGEAGHIPFRNVPLTKSTNLKKGLVYNCFGFIFEAF